MLIMYFFVFCFFFSDSIIHTDASNGLAQCNFNMNNTVEKAQEPQAGLHKQPHNNSTCIVFYFYHYSICIIPSSEHYTSYMTQKKYNDGFHPRIVLNTHWDKIFKHAISFFVSRLMENQIFYKN